MPAKKKGNPLPLGDTLRDLALLRASDCNLSSALPSPSKTVPSDTSSLAGGQSKDVNESVERSYEFVKETRAAIRLLHRGEADKQGGRLEEVRSRLEDVAKGLETEEVR
ncbi:uncharacterized protein B0H18DRAFT_1012190 [Fomitopsis serialis]|uniref:uncharacterized protein n=1 Tax=Fomitopsis serialis TaxID=139415 RepID=UPI0020076AE1|nr:uncharacterized protein B0H18DRAFT_1012190 [Neoantrodia serialis]KAH9924440.1 hypothetical protein B0H18DRAFT_1012190 [Neoantrodia serialis]